MPTVIKCSHILFLCGILLAGSPGATAQVNPFIYFRISHCDNCKVTAYINETVLLKDGCSGKLAWTPVLLNPHLQQNDKKIEGEIQYNYPFIMERIVVFRGQGRTTFLHPRDIKAYFVDGILRESVTANMSLMAGMKTLETYFMIPEIEGKVSLYWFSGENPTSLEDNADLSQWGNYWTAYSAYDRMREGEIQKFTPKTRLIQKEGETAIGTDALVMSFAKRVSAMLEDCPELSARIKSKEKGYRYSDIEKIIGEYNACVQE